MIINELKEIAQQTLNCFLKAFGCGVFRNDPKRIAQIWKELLIDEGMRFDFQGILFAVYDRNKTQNNIKAFTLMLG